MNGSSGKSLNTFIIILVSRIGNWHLCQKITGIAQRFSMNQAKMSLVFLRIIRRFRIVGRETNNNTKVEAGFVEKEEDYWYSSAGDFYGKKGLIELSYIV
jgi:hypothetical protein